MKTINDLINKISLHNILLKKTLTKTDELLAACKGENEAKVQLLSENRDSMINDLQKIQDQICKELENIPAALLNESTIRHIKEWDQLLNSVIAEIHDKDLEIIEILEAQKQTITGEIASTFENKTKLGGYNLDNVKRK